MAFFRRRTTADAQASQTEKQRAKREDFTLQWDFGELGDDESLSSSSFDENLYTLRPTAIIDEISTEASQRNVRALWSTRPLVKPWQAPITDTNLEAVRTALDNALEQWWGDGTLPAKPLVRDGLLALEAGHDLDEGHRSLLLRAALAYGRGTVTALHHQTDGERTAFMLKEMLLDPRTPVAPELIWRLRQEDSKSATWVSFLISELQYELQLVVGAQQQQVEQALDYLQGIRTPKITGTPANPRVNGGAGGTVGQPTAPPIRPPYWTYGRLLIMGLLALLVTVRLVLGWQNTAAAGAATIPGGEYMLRDPSQPQKERKVELHSFAIDRAEVTNGDYQRCYHAGVCPAPTQQASATRQNYFSATAFADFPVVNVSWAEANQYCQWQGKRLPTAEQWQVAASIAPATQRAFRYPWGDQFDSNLANTQKSGLLDTKPVGAYHPNGDSGFGVMDMAGNVAEWTATQAATNSNEYIVKGGSFQDKAEDSATEAQQQMADQSRMPWLGFRCSAELAD
jgi:formylglycine-generating enzyme required for sulfatase activity